MRYTCYFEFFGHKMKHTIQAENEEHAKDLIRYKIKFNKILPEHGGEDIMQQLFDIFNGVGL